MINFNELNQLLASAACGSRAAECHGFLCGYLCVRSQVEDTVLKECLMAELEENDLAPQCMEELSLLSRSVSEQISSANFKLELLLPGDDMSLADRSAALTEWCEGFLGGLGTAGMTDFDLLSFECRELIQDLYKICRLDPASIRDSSEEDEAALMELIEYVRMGAMLVHDELRMASDRKSESANLH